jgi:hypothetical protein
MGSTGDMQLDIVFSDHHMSHKTIANLGKVITSIREEAKGVDCDTEPGRDAICFWSFITYISRNHSSILQAKAPPECSDQVDELLARATLPRVEIQPGFATTRSEPDDSVTIELPEPLASQLRRELQQPLLAKVDLRLCDGSVTGPYFLICDQARAVLVGRQRDQVKDVPPTEVVAVRLRFSLVAPFRKRPWIGG